MNSVAGPLTMMLSGGLVVLLLAPMSLPMNSRQWWHAVLLISAIAFTGNLTFCFHQAGQPNSSLLTRDIIAWVILAGGVPLLTAAVARGVAGLTGNVWVHAGAGAFLLIIWAVAAPFIILTVHCTSGDCL